MKIILASANKGKVKEFKSWMNDFEVLAFSEVMEPFDIIEDGNSFKENALIKARAVYEKLEDKSSIVISDDSGISVNILNHQPGIYSARYAGVNATDKENNEKLISKLNEKNLTITPAFYTACLAIAYKDDIYTTHGWMHGNVINKEKGEGGFGYDPLFIPNGYFDTLGNLDNEVKKELSHRSKALSLCMKQIKVILK